MSAKPVSRRKFITTVAIAGAAVTLGCPRRPPVQTGGVKVFKRSARGIHVSNAAKLHNANKLYKTESAALGDKPHKGDKSFVVSLIISRSMFNSLFSGGNLVADLRHDL